MISFEFGSNKYHYRVGGIIRNENFVLFQQVVGDTLWFIPGGRVEINETSEETICREMEEEFAISILNKQLVWIAETFVKFPEGQLHEVALYYLLEVNKDHYIFNNKNEFYGEEGSFINKWIHIDELHNYRIVPEFVVPELRSLDALQGIKHIVHKSVG